MSSVHYVFISNSLACCRHKRWPVQFSDSCFCWDYSSKATFTLALITFLIFVRAGVFVFKSKVKILIEPSIKLFLSLLSPISSSNLSKISWNIFSNNVITPSVESPLSVWSPNILSISVTILLTFSVFASSMLSLFWSFLFFVSPIFFHWLS